MTSTESLYHLREDAYFEPLVFKWYAWPYLLPPVSAAMNIVGRSLRLMKSFVANHELHLSASKDPKLAGGDFVSCPEAQLGDVRELIHEIETHHTDYFEVREAVAEINKLLEPMKGMSLESLYPSLPPALRGYVELVYDMSHAPSFRLIEGLLYESGLYKESMQSICLGVLSRTKERPFVLSSPRFPDTDHLHVEARFAEPFVDSLFAARDRPVSEGEIAAMFRGMRVAGGLGIRELFTAESPKIRHQPPTGDMRISYLGHAGLMLETAHTAILVDPVIAARDGRDGHKVVSFSELPASIDYICLTHTHMDHVCIETLLQLRHKTKRLLVPKNNGGGIADPSLKLMLRKLGFDAMEIDEMEQIAVRGGRIRALPFLGEHADLNIRSKTAWLFELGGKKIFVGADSSSIDEVVYQRIQRVTGDVDLLFIGMECVGAPMSWLYGSLFTRPIPRAINESRRFNGSDCASVEKMIAILKPSEVYIYALGMEPWFKYFMGLDYGENARQVDESSRALAACASRGIRAERLFGKRLWNF